MPKKFSSIVKQLKNDNVKRTWTQTELSHLKQLKYAGIFVSTIVKNTKLMDEFFPGRTYSAMDTKYRRIII